MIPMEQLITSAYRSEQVALHMSPRGYGQRGRKWADTVANLMVEYRCGSLLDYGCGQGSLVTDLRQREGMVWRLAEYDPAIPGKDAAPTFADLVVCTDVLEHVEPELLANVLTHLRQLARHAVFVVVSLVETAKVLSDGRNAHLTIQPREWWQQQFEAAGFRMAPFVADRGKPEKEWAVVLLP